MCALPSGVWYAFSIEPVPYQQIHPDLPAVVWRPDGQHLDAHTAAVTPRLAYPIHLCPGYLQHRDRMAPVGASLNAVYLDVVTGQADVS